MPERPIDLRSDTVTVPSDGMRRAIAAAEVGDDVWGEDPTVIRLQEVVAELLGKEAALFVPSGTMANLAALMAHIHHGDEVLVGWGSHCITYEAGAGAAVGGALYRVLGTDGTFTAAEVHAALRPANVHFAPTRLVWIENTHNQGGGRIFDQEEVERIATVARENALAVHVDGARLLNAAVASGRPARELVAPVDSTSICLSKGLGAPVGSVLAGSADFIERTYRYRKMLGGGMRQVGILAAAGLYALEHNVERLAQDHANARLLAEGLAQLRGLQLAPERVDTNIVIFEVDHPWFDAPALVRGCRDKGVLMAYSGGERVRAVTHLDVTRDQCEEAVRIIEKLLQA
jgi:threonine aldolase